MKLNPRKFDRAVRRAYNRIPVEIRERTIYIFQEPLEEMCQTVGELEREIEITVVHEVAYFLGIEEERREVTG